MPPNVRSRSSSQPATTLGGGILEAPQRRRTRLGKKLQQLQRRRRCRRDQKPAAPKERRRFLARLLPKARLRGVLKCALCSPSCPKTARGDGTWSGGDGVWSGHPGMYGRARRG